MSDKHDWQALSVELAMNAKNNLDAKDDEITSLQSEVERLRGRCGELTEIVAMAETPCRAWYKQANDGGWQIYSAVQQAAKGNSGAWLLRKQADAVESILDFGTHETICGEGISTSDIADYAQRLRQQAEELESK